MAINFNSQGSQSGNPLSGILNKVGAGKGTGLLSPNLSSTYSVSSPQPIPVPAQKPMSSTNSSVVGILPSTPLKKTTTTDAQGGTTTHEFHTPTTPTPPPTVTPIYSTKDGHKLLPGEAPDSMAQGSTPQTNDFAGFTKALGNQQGSTNNQVIGNAQNSLANTGASGTADIDAAKNELAKQQGMDIQNQQGIANQAIPIGFEQGQAQTAQLAQAKQEAALQQNLTNILTNRGQNIGATEGAGSLGVSGQNLGQSALNSAAGLSQPQLGSIGSVPFNPLNQSQGNILGTQGGGINAAGAVLGQLQGATTTSANQYAQTEQYKSAHQQAMNLGSQLSDLITTFGLDPSNLNVANAGIQKIAQNTSDPHYKMLSNYLADVASRYSQILTPAGGSSTDTTRAVASGMLDGIASGKSIIEVMNGLDQQAQAVIAGVGTNNTGTPNNGTSGSSTGGGLYNF